MELQTENIINILTQFVEWCSASILLYGFFKVFIQFWIVEFKSYKDKSMHTVFNSLRPEIGSYILLGLDFYIISDILHSMIVQDSNTLIRLGVVVIIRTIIGYFLGKEITEYEKLEKENSIP